MQQSVEDRFWAKVRRGEINECWPWTGTTDGNGRGQFWLDGRRHRAPRIAWMLHYGKPFPLQLYACHSCDNPSCVNPTHIWPGTPSENIRDAVAKGRLIVPVGDWQARKTVCDNGHPFDESNTCYRQTGGRSCRTCARQRRAAHRARNRERDIARKRTARAIARAALEPSQ